MTGFDDDRPGLVEKDDLAVRREQARNLRGGLVAEPADGLVDRVNRLLDLAGRRHEAGEHQAAIGLARRALELDEACVPAWQRVARCLADLKNLDLAITELRKARRLVADPAGQKQIDQMLAVCVRRRTGAQVENARRALRRGHPEEAVALLTACRAAFGDDPDFRARLTYAEERMRAVAERRRPDGSTSLARPVLQAVLAWLCADELAYGARAIEAEEFDRAAEFFGNARRLDARFTRAALDEARALYDHWRTQSRPEPARQLLRFFTAEVEALTRAESLAERARDDRAVAGEAAPLLTSIKAERAGAIKKAGAWDCVVRLDHLGEYYRRERVLTWQAYNNLRSSFAPIGVKVDRLVLEHGLDDPEIGWLLKNLADAVRRTRDNLA